MILAPKTRRTLMDPLEAFLRFDTWKILAGAFLGVVGKTVWDHYVKRQRLSDMVAREVRAQVAEYQRMVKECTDE
jgi:hypothetical protein